MPTVKQKLAAKKLMVEDGRPVGQVLREIGYSEAVATQPQKVTESVGFKEALDEFGLTEKLVVCSLAQDIKEKGKLDIEKRNRVQELLLAAKMRKMLEPEEKGTGNVNINVVNFYGHNDPT